MARSISDEAISSYRQGATIAGDCFAPLAKTKCLASPPNDIHVSRKGPPIRRRGERHMARFDILVLGGGSAGSAAAGRLAADGTRRLCPAQPGRSTDLPRVKPPGLLPLPPPPPPHPPPPPPPPPPP